MKINKILPLAVIIALSLFFLRPNLLKSDDLQKANVYYDHYDYNYAIKVYEKIMAKKPTLEVAEKLANCYRFINNTVAAENAYEQVFKFPCFLPENYKYYAEVLKQNGKFEKAKYYYVIYGERVPEQKAAARVLADGCDTARKWLDHPILNLTIENEEILNSAQAEFSPIAYRNGFIFASDRAFMQSDEAKKAKIYGWTGNPYLKLYQAEPSTIGAYKITLLPELINAPYHNGPAALSLDEKTLFFTRAGALGKNEALKGKKKVVLKKAVYFSESKNGIWSAAAAFPYNSPYQYSIEHPALSPDGNTLYFASDMPGGYGGLDLYFSEKTKAGWAKPVNCGAVINTKEDEVFPMIRKDGKLYFSSKGHTTIGGLDIFSADGAKNTWTPPENLKAPFNSVKDDFGIYFFEDTTKGYLSSNREGGKGQDDIYRFTLKSTPEIYFAVEGKVVEKDSEIPVPNIQIFLLNKKTDQEIVALSKADGTFRFDLDKNTEYLVHGDTEKFFSKQEGTISSKGLKETTIFNVKFEVEKGEDALLVRLKNIYYDFDKYNIRKDAEPDLYRVMNFLSNTPNVDIELRSHTDARGNAAYNMWLSEKRAASAKNWLLQKGVNMQRLSAKGYGETQLLNKCADGVKCTKEEHAFNRRTEFKVIKINPVLSYKALPNNNY